MRRQERKRGAMGTGDADREVREFGVASSQAVEKLS